MLLILTIAVVLVAVTATDAGLLKPANDERAGYRRPRHMAAAGRSRGRATARWWWEVSN